MLVSGEGGQGKTRLARQFAARARQAGWAAGFLAARTSGLAPGGGRDQLPSTVGLAAHARAAARPVLLVVDYAETRPDEITALADILAGSPPAYPVRVLLLSRTAGAWWANLTETLGPHLTHRISLEPLTVAGATRRDAYAAAVTGLARRLAALPDSPVERAPDQPWGALAEHLAAYPPGLDDPRLGNALTLQITALTSLLDAAAGRTPASDSGERELIGHERGYLRRSAARRRLFSPGMLSDRVDDDERAEEAWAALERALAGIILLGPCDVSQARAIGALTSQARADDVANWLAALYPPPGEGFRLGTVQPDRIAELLLGPILIRQPALLGEIGIVTEAVDDAYAALFALMRTAAHPRFSQVGEQVADLIISRPAPFAVAAPVLAATLAQRGPLRDGLVCLGQQDPEAFRQNAYAIIDQLPEISVSGALFSAALTTEITDILRQLAASDPDAYLPDLASALNNLGNRLANAGQRQAALAPAQEAADTYRQLAAAEPDAYLPALASALNNLGSRLAEAGQRQAALAPAQEA
ncbi:MAG TPA: tetratricopeptide repeat protein, partial [Streptosporangiaceae bacterium]|nr:tetratricopeptide repeat protein [Streptosporangiaceae bacterium]